MLCTAMLVIYYSTNKKKIVLNHAYAPNVMTEKFVVIL